MLKTLALASALLCVLTATSFACDAMRPCFADGRSLYGPQTYTGGAASSRRVRPSVTVSSSSISRRNRVPPGLQRVMAEGAGRVVAHPSGCPARAFCGCGASVRVFGRSIRSLWLAANWLRFPRTQPAPGMAAARRGHVFVLESHISGSTWLVYDANSGRHRTQIHARSIAGFTIVDPRGA